MIEATDIMRKTQSLERLFAEKLGLVRGPLKRRNLRARRMLPARVRRDIETVVRAGIIAGHPKLAQQLDSSSVEDAYRRAETHLRGLSRAGILWNRTISVLASIAFGLIVAFCLYLSVLIWRGFL